MMLNTDRLNSGTGGNIRGSKSLGIIFSGLQISEYFMTIHQLRYLGGGPTSRNIHPQFEKHKCKKKKCHLTHLKKTTKKTPAEKHLLPLKKKVHALLHTFLWKYSNICQLFMTLFVIKNCLCSQCRAIQEFQTQMNGLWEWAYWAARTLPGLDCNEHHERPHPRQWGVT